MQENVGSCGSKQPARQQLSARLSRANIVCQTMANGCRYSAGTKKKTYKARRRINPASAAKANDQPQSGATTCGKKMGEETWVKYSHKTTLNRNGRTAWPSSVTYHRIKTALQLEQALPDRFSFGVRQVSVRVRMVDWYRLALNFVTPASEVSAKTMQMAGCFRTSLTARSCRLNACTS